MPGVDIFVLIVITLFATGSTERSSNRWLDSRRDIIYTVTKNAPLENTVLLFDNDTGLIASDMTWSDGGNRTARTYLPVNVDLLTSDGFMEYIIQLTQRYSGTYLHFIAVLEDVNIITVINQINYIDENSKKSTNIRHWSTWIIFHHLHVFKPLENLVTQFDNMAVVYLRDKGDEYACLSDVMTLVMTKYGSKFQPVDISRDDIQLFLNLNYGYNGRHFDIITKIWRSYIQEELINDKLVYKGYIPDVIDFIAHKLNFTYSFYHDRESTWDDLINDTKTGMTYKIANGEFDIMAAPSIVSEGRMELVDYAFPAYFTDKLIPTYRKRVGSSFLLYTKPFQTVVLVSILASFIFCCCLLWTVEYINPYNMDKEKTSIQVKIFHTVGIVLNQSGILKLDSSTGRIWLVSFWFFCIIMGSVYRANLVAFFAYTKPAEEFTSLEDMIDSDYRIGCVGGSTFLKNSENHSIPVYKRLFGVLNTNMRLYPETGSTDNAVHLANLLAGNYVYLADSSSTSHIHANNCDVVRFHSSIYEYFFAFGVQKKSPLKFDLEDTMNELEQTGMLTRWQKKWWPQRRKELCDAPLRVKQLHLSDIYSIFILLSVCLAVCFCTLCVELIRNQYVSNKFRLQH